MKNKKEKNIKIFWIFRYEYYHCLELVTRIMFSFVSCQPAIWCKQNRFLHTNPESSVHCLQRLNCTRVEDSNQDTPLASGLWYLSLIKKGLSLFAITFETHSIHGLTGIRATTDRLVKSFVRIKTQWFMFNLSNYLRYPVYIFKHKI